MNNINRDKKIKVRLKIIFIKFLLLKNITKSTRGTKYKFEILIITVIKKIKIKFI